MLLNHCPERAARNLIKDRNACAICREKGMACGMQQPFLIDQKGYRFPLQRQVFPEGCILRVLGALPTDLRTYRRELRQLGAGMLLHFTTETTEEKISVIKAFDLLRHGISPDKPADSTGGSWKRSVE
jgi:hypothetical protein